MPKSVPLRAIATTIDEPGTSRAASALTLPAAIARLRKKWSLPADEPQDVAGARVGQVTGQLADEQRGRGPVAVVQLVAHVQGLRHDRPQVDRAVRAHGVAQRGAEQPAIQRSRSMTSGPYAP